MDRRDFIREWHDKGYPEPEGGWKEYEIHHITPREYGGQNDFKNLVPLDEETHNKFSNWWKNYGDK